MMHFEKNGRLFSLLIMTAGPNELVLCWFKDLGLLPGPLSSCPLGWGGRHEHVCDHGHGPEREGT